MYDYKEVDNANKICVDLPKEHDVKCDGTKTVKRCYLDLALKLHPDKNPADQVAKYTRISQEVNGAYGQVGSLIDHKCDEVPKRAPRPAPGPAPGPTQWFDFNVGSIFKNAFEYAKSATVGRTFIEFKTNFIKYSMRLVFLTCIVVVTFCGSRFMITNGDKYGPTKYTKFNGGGKGSRRPPSYNSSHSRTVSNNPRAAHRLVRRQTDYLASRTPGPGRHELYVPDFRTEVNRGINLACVYDDLPPVKEHLAQRRAYNKRQLKITNDLIYALFVMHFAPVIMAQNTNDLHALATLVENFGKVNVTALSVPSTSIVGKAVNSVYGTVFGGVLMTDDTALQKVCAAFDIPAKECTKPLIEKAVHELELMVLNLGPRMENLLAAIYESDIQSRDCGGPNGRYVGKKMEKVVTKVPGTLYGTNDVVTEVEMDHFVKCAYPMRDVIRALPNSDAMGSGVNLEIDMSKLNHNLNVLKADRPEYCPNIPIITGRHVHRKQLDEFKKTFMDELLKSKYKDTPNAATLYNECVLRQGFLDMATSGLDGIRASTYKNPLQLVKGPVRDTLTAFNNIDSLLMSPEDEQNFNSGFKAYAKDNTYRGMLTATVKEAGVFTGETIAAPFVGATIGVANQIGSRDFLTAMGTIFAVALGVVYVGCHAVNKVKRAVIPSIADFKGQSQPQIENGSRQPQQPQIDNGPLQQQQQQLQLQYLQQQQLLLQLLQQQQQQPQNPQLLLLPPPQGAAAQGANGNGAAAQGPNGNGNGANGHGGRRKRSRITKHKNKKRKAVGKRISRKHK